jgi:hypothetical protein
MFLHCVFSCGLSRRQKFLCPPHKRVTYRWIVLGWGHPVNTTTIAKVIILVQGFVFMPYTSTNLKTPPGVHGQTTEYTSTA